ncbi:MAG TPA: crosslink repair DNA glycosylase YcaQ family protein [Acidobacteriota bacterium]|nr:crosslink repair DNA glycosylase YcaQ family protein [Acidobacteriota bacterium]
MDLIKLRAWWAHRQGLDGGFTGKSAAEILGQTGWARSVGGVGPYLTLFARGGIGRPAADESVAHLEIHELPSARGCTYVVPASDFALALKVGQNFGFESDMKTARKIGVTDAEVDRLCSAVLDALAKGPLDPEQIRDAAGNAARSLGEEGKKKGLNSTLPLALGKLQSDGEIRRLPINGRLDQQRYRYALWRPNPLSRHSLSMEESYTELARRYFSWIGPATLAEFQWFSGLGAKACRAAVEPLGLVAPENGSEYLMLQRDLEKLRGFGVPKKPNYMLVSSLDGIGLLRRDLKGLIGADDLKRSVFAEKGFRELGGLSDLPNHAILERGRLVGLWEYDPESESIAWMSFGIRDKVLTEAVSRTEAFIRSDLGDARSFSLDSPKSRAPRIQALRKS